MMKILVTTPAGVIGRRVLPELLAPEFSVRVISPTPQLLPRQIRDQVEVRQGSTDNVKTLRQALEGIDAMLWCVPERFLDQSNASSHYERFNRVAFQAIRETGTPRVVAVSSSRTPGRGVSSPDLHMIEEILNNSGAAIRHIRCGPLMEDFLRQANVISEGGLISASVPAEVPVAFTAATDVADIALHRLVRTDWDGIKSTLVQGPEALTFAQAAAIFERILRRPVRYQQQDSTSEFGQPDDDSGSNPESSRMTSPTTLAVWVRREFLPLLKRLEKRNLSGRKFVTSLQSAHQESNLSEVC